MLLSDVDGYAMIKKLLHFIFNIYWYSYGSSKLKDGGLFIRKVGYTCLDVVQRVSYRREALVVTQKFYRYHCFQCTHQTLHLVRVHKSTCRTHWACRLCLQLWVLYELRFELRSVHVCVRVSACTCDCTNPHILCIRRVRGNSDVTV